MGSGPFCKSKASDLFQRYVDAALKKGMIQLERNAVARSQRRTELIRNWVKDGLKQKVDLLQAEMTEINQKEMVESAKLNFKASNRVLVKLLVETR